MNANSYAIRIYTGLILAAMATGTVEARNSDKAIPLNVADDLPADARHQQIRNAVEGANLNRATRAALIRQLDKPNSFQVPQRDMSSAKLPISTQVPSLSNMGFNSNEGEYVKETKAVPSYSIADLAPWMKEASKQAIAGTPVITRFGRVGYVSINDQGNPDNRNGWGETATWQIFGDSPSREYRGNGVAVPSTIVALPDGSVAIGGRETDPKNKACVFARLSIIRQDGNLDFDEIYSSKDNCRTFIHQMTYLPDTGEILGVGETENKFGSSLWVFKFDVESRLMLWTKEYNLARDLDRNVNDAWPYVLLNGRTSKTTTHDDIDTRGYGIVHMNNGFVVVGSMKIRGSDEPGSDNSEDALIIRFLSTGKIIWARACGGTRTDRAYTIAATSDGFVVGGFTDSKNASIRYGWVLRLDPGGYLRWETRVDQSEIRLVIPVGKDQSIYAVDDHRAVYQLNLSYGAHFGGNPYWGGNWSWTSWPGVIVQSSGHSGMEGRSNAALTCRDMYWGGDILGSFRDIRIRK